MGAPSKTPTGVIKGRLVPNPEIEKRRKNRGNKLHPKYAESVHEMHEKEEAQRIRVAPKGTILDPPQQNLMFDYRIHRGSPFATSRPKPLPPPHKPKPKKVHPRMPTPELVVLDCYLEALPKPEQEDFDPPLPKRSIPPFAPWPKLPEKETQVWPGDLFNFDDDVEPMLEQLVGRCLEQGYMECQEDLQIEVQRAQQENFEFIKIAEFDCGQRMCLVEIRVEEERLRRIEQEKISDHLEKLLKIKVESQSIGNSFLKRLKDNVLDSCEAKGMFYDPLEEELKSLYLPRFVKEMEEEYNELIKYRQTFKLVVDETVECPDYIERAEDGMDIILGRLIMILDSWISFEDNVMLEMDAAESASQRIMLGSVGEVGLVTDTSETILDQMIETTGEASDMAQRIVQSILGQFEDEES